MTLSLILCSRNDSYMGNSVWRLETALNFVSARLAEIGRIDQAEIVLTDWGSDTPLHDTLRLTATAQSLVRFVHVPPAVAMPLQRDSPFPEVIALNAAARRARGRFVGRIDQDTLVGADFLRAFFSIADGTRDLGVVPDDTLFFSNHRRVPYGFASLCPSLDVVERFVSQFGRRFMNDHTNPRAPYYSAGVGIWLLPRAVWNASGGYDERMIYMNWMEVRMVERLTPRHKMVDLGRILDYDFYHLEHYHPTALRKSAAHRVTNNQREYEDAGRYTQNGDAWGLAAQPVVESRSTTASVPARAPLASLGYAWLLGYVGLRLLRDGVLRRVSILRREWPRVSGHWARRTRLALGIVLRHAPWQWRGAVTAARAANRLRPAPGEDEK
ncbi:MAG: hypothetical protein ABL982_05540 [Vicinamibacterales bacterium]